MAKQKKVTINDWLQTGLIRVCRVHFMLIGLFAVYTIAADATGLTTSQLVLQRWTMNAILLVGVGTVWYLARNTVKNTNYYRALIYSIILLDIALATFNIYTQRGMASRAVILYSIALVVSALLLSRTALFFVAALCTATYALTAVRYFVDFFNEGYKAELYIEVGFYCAVFFIMAGILSVIIRFKNSETDLGL